MTTSTNRHTRASRNYGLRFGGAALLYTVAIFICLPVARGMDPGAARYLVAMIPTLPILVGIWALASYLKEADELSARMLLEAVAFGCAGCLVIGFGWGMAQLVGAPVMNPFWVVPIWAVFFGIGMIRSTWKYNR